MIELTAIGGLLDVANKLWTVRGSLAKADTDHRIAIAGYLGDVALSVDKIASALKTSFDADVAQVCAELRTYGELGGRLLSGVLPDTEIMQFSGLMIQPARVLASVEERQRIAPADRKAFIATLDEAAGRLRATSNILRAGRLDVGDGQKPARGGFSGSTSGHREGLPGDRGMAGAFPLKRYMPKGKVGKVVFWIVAFYVVIFILYGIFVAIGLIDPNSCDFNARPGCRPADFSR